MSDATKTNPAAGYIVFEAGRIAFETEELKLALEFCMAGPGRAIYGSMAVNKGTANKPNATTGK